MSYLLQVIDQFDRHLFLALNQPNKNGKYQVFSWITALGGLRFHALLPLLLPF